MHHRDHFFFNLSRLTTILVVTLLIFSSCQPSQESKPSDKVSPHDRELLQQFFSDIMLFHHGIYTLWGANKPITVIPVTDYSDEELKAMYDALPEEEKKTKKSLSVDVIEGYKLSEAWKKWEQISLDFPTNRFMLFKQESSDPHVFFIVFLDTFKTAALIQDNYEAFHSAMGFDFHPMEVTLQMNQKDSIFWKNLNSYLYGLLFGFGKINSQLFHWKYFDHPKSCDEFCNNIKFYFSNKQLNGHIKFSIDNFLIPSFMSFNEIDPILNAYKEEREMIKDIYRNKDFLDLTLQKFSG